MKKLVVVLEVAVPDDTPVAVVDQLGQEHLLKMLCCDAFGEFRSARGPTPEEYVAKRYPAKDEGGKEMHWPFKLDEKAREVGIRRSAAELLRNACAGGGLQVEMLEVREPGEEGSAP